MEEEKSDYELYLEKYATSRKISIEEAMTHEIIRIYENCLKEGKNYDNKN